MQVVLDEPVNPNDGTNVKYASFWPRFGATIVDGLVFLPLTVGITYLNAGEWRSIVVQLAVSLASIGYKPAMEFMYGATLGKMALRIKVTDLNYEKADLGKILLRNIFNIVPGVLSLFLMVSAFGDGFNTLGGYQFKTFGQNVSADMIISLLSGVIGIVDGVILMTDDQSRSLHDKIAGTFVIER